MKFNKSKAQALQVGKEKLFYKSEIYFKLCSFISNAKLTCAQNSHEIE